MKLSKIRKLRKAITKSSKHLNDEIAIDVPQLFKTWVTDITVNTGERYQFESILYRVVQSHTTQADWTPDVTPALWAVVSLEEFPEWVQPTGVHDSYQKGDKVTFEGDKYESKIDNNVWPPDEYGWFAI